jgi:hypothetical protein
LHRLDNGKRQRGGNLWLQNAGGHLGWCGEQHLTTYREPKTTAAIKKVSAFGLPL